MPAKGMKGENEGTNKRQNKKKKKIKKIPIILMSHPNTI